MTRDASSARHSRSHLSDRWQTASAPQFCGGSETSATARRRDAWQSRSKPGLRGSQEHDHRQPRSGRVRVMQHWVQTRAPSYVTRLANSTSPRRASWSRTRAKRDACRRMMPSHVIGHSTRECPNAVVSCVLYSTHHCRALRLSVARRGCVTAASENILSRVRIAFMTWHRAGLLTSPLSTIYSVSMLCAPRDARLDAG